MNRGGTTKRDSLRGTDKWSSAGYAAAASGSDPKYTFRAEHEGLNPSNAAIEIHVWRKFNGIKAEKPVKASKVKESE